MRFLSSSTRTDDKGEEKSIASAIMAASCVDVDVVGKWCRQTCEPKPIKISRAALPSIRTALIT